MTRLTSRWPLLAGLILIACAFWWWSGRPVTTFETAPVAKGNIEAVVAATGTLQPRQSVEVGAQVSGQIVRLLVEPGDVVTRGQLLAEIDPAILQASVDAGRAQIAAYRAQLDDAEGQHILAGQNLARQRQMDAEGATRAEDLQTAVATARSARARIAQLRAQIDQTASGLRANEAQLGFTRIYAPIAGTVLSVDVKEGQTLNATYQTPTVLTIADLGAMTVRVNVAEADIRHIKVGMAASFTTLGDETRRWEGPVRQVLPAPAKGKEEEKPGAIILYTVLFDVENRDKILRPQMTAQVAFVTQSAKQVLTVPLAALAPVEGKPDTYSVRVLNQSGEPQSREIKTGRRDSMNAEVVSGLEAGDQVVTGEVSHATRRASWQ